MQISHHAEQRRVEGDQHVDRNESRRLIESLTKELRLAKRVMDQGGITVVEGGDTLITAYNRAAIRARRGTEPTITRKRDSPANRGDFQRLTMSQARPARSAVLPKDI